MAPHRRAESICRLVAARLMLSVSHLSFRGGSKSRTRNLEIPGLVLAHHPGMTLKLSGPRSMTCRHLRVNRETRLRDLPGEVGDALDGHHVGGREPARGEGQ